MKDHYTHAISWYMLTMLMYYISIIFMLI